MKGEITVDIKKVQYFLAVAETLNFKKAAEKLYISTQALSLQIIQIENELGARLLERTTKKVQLTTEGELFVSKFSPVLKHYEKALREFSDYIEKHKEIVRIGFFNGMEQSKSVTPVVNYLADMASNAEIDVFSSSLGNLKKLMKEDKIDLAVTLLHDNERWDDFEKIVLEKIPVQIVVSKRHPWAAKEKITAEDIKDGTLLLLQLDRGEFIDESIYGSIKCKDSKVVPDVDSLMITLNMGNSFGILPRKFPQMKPRMYKTFKMPPEYLFNFYNACIYKKESPFAGLFETLKEFNINSKKDVPGEPF
ncbi:MAG: LysR [Firmicutes bacterium]|nr:LysR [Bacillota bacterium]